MDPDIQDGARSYKVAGRTLCGSHRVGTLRALEDYAREAALRGIAGVDPATVLFCGLYKEDSKMGDAYILICTAFCGLCVLIIMWLLSNFRDTTGSLLTEMKRLRQELDEHEEEHKRLRSRISSIPKVGDN